MRKRISRIFLFLLFLIGAGIFAYPTISDQWNRYHQSQVIAEYQETMKNPDKEETQKLWEETKAYNEKIQKNTFDHDAFSQEEKNLRETDYWQVLNLDDNGIMGYLEIPKIQVRLPIYHGTSETVLQIGAGHLYGTNLPIGGEGNHSVIAGHRGLPSAKLFTDLDELETGDVFYIHILDQVLTYEVDQISDMIEKDDMDTLTDRMKQVEGEDYVTLFTCTPYGVNSHRLLVRGHRIETPTDFPAEKVTVDRTPILLLSGVGILFLILLIGFGIGHYRKKERKK